MRSFFEHASPRLGNPMRVARLIVRLCEKRRVPLRTRIGVDAQFMAGLGWLVPGRARIALVEWAFRYAVFGGAK